MFLQQCDFQTVNNRPLKSIEFIFQPPLKRGIAVALGQNNIIRPQVFYHLPEHFIICIIFEQRFPKNLNHIRIKPLQVQQFQRRGADRIDQQLMPAGMQNILNLKIQLQIIKNIHQLHFHNQFLIRFPKVFRQINKLMRKNRRQVKIQANLPGPVHNVRTKKSVQRFLVQRLGQIKKQPAAGQQIKALVQMCAQILDRHKKFLKRNPEFSRPDNLQSALPFDNLRNINRIKLGNDIINLIGAYRALPLIRIFRNLIIVIFVHILNLDIERSIVFGKIIQLRKIFGASTVNDRIGRQSETDFLYRFINRVFGNIFP